nr:immunoglobulin light chain junction region [Macaca mulatta]
CLQGFRSPFSF